MDEDREIPISKSMTKKEEIRFILGEGNLENEDKDQDEDEEDIDE